MLIFGLVLESKLPMYSKTQLRKHLPLFIIGVFFIVSLLLVSFMFTSRTTAQTVDVNLVQKATAGTHNQNTIEASFATAATTDNLLVVVCGSREGGTFPAPTGFTLATTHTGIPGQAIFYKVAVGGETTFTCAPDNTSTRHTILAYEFSGIATTDPLIGSLDNTGSSGSPQAQAITVAAPSFLVVGSTINSEAVYSAWSNSFTLLDSVSLNQGRPQDRIASGSASRVVATAGSYGTTATTSGNAAWRAQIVAFRPAGIPPPTLSLDIIDTFGEEVASPMFTMSALNTSFSCQQASGTLGVSDQKLRITNTTTTPSWSLSMAATGGSTANWESGVNTYSFNDSSGGGCENGQLAIQPSSASINPGSCSTNGLNLGSNTAFISGSVDNITLLSANSGADIGCSWEVTGIGMEQNVPAEQPSGEYNLDMTLTLVVD